MSDGCASTASESLDKLLEEVDIEDLERFAAVGDGTMMSPPFHNVFFNAFVNAPGFQKRLRRS